MIEQLRPWIELLYFVSGIAVAIGVVYGLKQIRLLKKDIRLRNERAAKEKAIEYGRRYLRDYVQLNGAFFDDCQSGKLESYFGPIGDFTSGSVLRSEEAGLMANKRYALPSWLPAMNELEAISAAFTSGVADEATGFNIVGRTFCKSVEHSYDLIALSRHKANDAHGYWSNIVQLYKMWSPRLEEAELRQAKEHLDSRIATVSARGTRIPPIGTE
jgi:hypothetical protein